MKLVNRRRALTGLVTGLLSGCTGLQTLNTVNAFASGDEGGAPVLKDEPYGKDLRHLLDVYAPSGAGTNAPVLIFFYGGAWSSGQRQDYRFVGEAFSAQGFVTVIPDYRLVPFVHFPGFLEDCAKAFAWVHANIARFGGDPGRIALAGHSAGAYNAVMLALDRRWLKEADTDPALVRAAIGLSGPYDFYPFDGPITKETFGAYPDPKATQPINFARRDAPPLLLATGTKDELVQPRNVEALASALKRKGARAEIKIYPGLDHVDTVKAIARAFRSTAPVLDDCVAFLKRTI